MDLIALLISSVALLLCSNIIEARSTKKHYNNRQKEPEKPQSSMTTYDQRQTGKYNIHFNIKDVQIVSLEDNVAGGIGDQYSYSDYEDYNEEYDEDHLTVNPILALLGSKPTTPKPTTHNPNDDIYITSKKPKPTTIKTSTIQTSPKATETQATEKIESTTTEAPIVIGMNETSHQIDTFKVDIDEGDIQAHYPHSKPSTIYLLKPQGNGGTNITQIDYDDIPVQVVFDPASRTRQNSYQQQFKKQNGRHATSNFNKRPNVEIIGDHSGRKNVKIIDGERIRPFVKICGQGEYKDQQGRCRVRRSGSSAMRNLFGLFSRFTQQDP